MKPFIPWILALSLALGWPSWSAANEDSDQALAACGHLDEMAAARQALVEGETEQALDLLKAARAILLECEKEAEIAADPDPEPELGRDLI